jgi:VanZ family protein
LKLHKIFSLWAPVLLWMAVIFTFSALSQPAQVLPGGVERTIADNLPYVRTSAHTWRRLTINEVAHPAEYALLGLLLLRALSQSGKRATLTLPWAGNALAIAAAYALLDETHQLFVPLRNFQLADLALDVTGALIGLGLYALWRYGLRKFLRDGHTRMT